MRNLQKNAELFDMLSDNSSVDHPLCEECTDTLLQCLELQLEQAEQDSQQYQVRATARLIIFSDFFALVQNYNIRYHNIDRSCQSKLNISVER